MFAGDSVHEVQAVFLLLLVFVAAFALMARWLKISYPIVLVLAGLLVSLLPHVPRIPLNPELVFLIFLPPLLAGSAWNSSWREIQYNAVNIGFLAVGLVAFTVWGVAEFSDRFVTALDWKSGFVLGAVVAATDAIAATSIASTLGLPRRIVDILEGESLLNDATGLLALEFGLQQLLKGTTPTVWEGVVRLAYLSLVGAAVGLAIGWVVAKGSKLINDGPVEIVISLVVPYTAYLAGESVKASGVIAVVVCGLYLSRQSAVFYSPKVRMQVLGVWDALEFMLNGVVFVLIGLQMPFVLSAIHKTYSWGTLLLYGSVFSAVLIALRLVWTFPAAAIAFLINKYIRKHTEARPPLKSVFVVGWTGMRGVLALAAAISLPEMLGDGKPFANRDLIVFLAFSVILVTLVLQGLSLPVLIRALGLAGAHDSDEEERAARRAVLENAVAHLEEGRERDGEQFEHIYEDLLHRYRHRLAAVGGGEDDDSYHGLDATTYARLKEISAGAVQAERRTMIQLRDEGRISDETLRTMEYELDLTEIRYQSIAE